MTLINLFKSTAGHCKTTLTKHNKAVPELELSNRLRTECLYPLLANVRQTDTHTLVGGVA